jgi:hypothetical protein
VNSERVPMSMSGVEEVIVGVQKVKIQSRSAMKAGRSCRVDENTMIAYAMGQPEAVATVNAWRFQANRATRIIQVSRQEYSQMVERQGSVNFGS